jgi:DNA-directed RNA polymerase specialized sigma24 family protein
MNDDGSVTVLLNAIKAEMDQEAAQKLYERYFRQLEHIARGKLRGSDRRVQDEEDVAQVVLGQFFMGVRRKRFPQLADRHDLWQVLMMILSRRVVDHRRRTNHREAALPTAANLSSQSSSGAVGEVIAAVSPNPRELLELEEELRRRVNQLPKKVLQRVAMWKLQQQTNAEIAALLDCSVSTVERFLRDIRKRWLGADS